MPGYSRESRQITIENGACWLVYHGAIYQYLMYVYVRVYLCLCL